MAISPVPVVVVPIRYAAASAYACAVGVPPEADKFAIAFFNAIRCAEPATPSGSAATNIRLDLPFPPTE